MASTSIVERIVEFIQPLFRDWGYLIVFLAAFLERSLLVGLVIPGNVVVMLAGLYAGVGDLNIAWIVAIAFIGSLLGDNLGYLIGLKLGRPLIDKHGDFMRMGARVSLVETYFDKYGGATILIARFVTFLGALVCPVAGMSMMNFRRFLYYELLGSLLWAMAFGLLGYFCGLNRDLIIKVFNYVGNTLLIIVLAIAAVAYVVHVIRERKAINIELDTIDDQELLEGPE
ncbi:MAG TPA: DedA family protein [Candidatus Anoxymicrobiaceae bacterium]